MKIKLRFVALLPVILALSSCSVMFQRGYVNTSPNVNCFDTVGEKNFKISAFLNHYEVQSNLAFTAHHGLSLSVNGGFRGQLGAEVAGIYYRRIKQKHYFEVQYGYGFYNNDERIRYMAWSLFAGERGTYFSNHSDVRYHKIFVQPTYFICGKKLKWGFALKLSANYFDNYYFYYCKTYQDYISEEFHYTADFRYKWGFAVEPSVKLEFRKPVFLQLSTFYHNNVQSFPSYYDAVGHEGGIINSDPTGDVKSPQHLSFVFTFGVELKFPKKKHD